MAFTQRHFSSSKAKTYSAESENEMKGRLRWRELIYICEAGNVLTLDLVDFLFFIFIKIFFVFFIKICISASRSWRLMCGRLMSDEGKVESDDQIQCVCIVALPYDELHCAHHPYLETLVLKCQYARLSRRPTVVSILLCNKLN